MTPFFPALPEAKPANPTAYGLAGYGAVQDIEGRQTTNALSQMQVDKAQRQQNALDVYGKTGGNIDEVMKIDPETGIALQAKQAAAQHEQMKSQAEMMKSGLDIYKNIVITKPEDLDKLADGLESKGFPKGFVKRASDFKTPQEFQAYKQELDNRADKGLGEYRKLKAQIDLHKADAYIKGIDARTAQGQQRVDQGQAHVDISRDRLAFDKTKPERGGKDDKDLDIKETRDILKIENDAQKQINRMSPSDKMDPTKTQPVLDKAKADIAKFRDAYAKRRGGAGKGGGAGKYPDVDPDSGFKKTGDIDPESGKPIYAAPDGSLHLPK